MCESAENEPRGVGMPAVKDLTKETETELQEFRLRYPVSIINKQAAS